MDLLRHGAERAVEGSLPLLCHEDLVPSTTEEERARARARLVETLRAGQLRRFAVRVSTPAGERIVKLSAADTFGSRLLGLWGRSRGRREHQFHSRAAALNLAAASSHGFLELRLGPQLLGSCQVQSLVSADCTPLGPFLDREVAAHGPRGLEPLGRALAIAHRVPFFHADLKSFHMFVSELQPARGKPASYRLRFIDLDRVAFWLSRRKRVINLYQVLRYVVPDEPSAQAHFVTAYCETSGWYANHPERALHLVRSFLAYKRETHPYP